MSSPAEINVVELVDSHESGPSKAYLDSDSRDPLISFSLKQNPFLDNVNPDFFFRTRAHEEAYLKMKHCIDNDISMGLISAQSGTGKTLLTQILLQDLDPSKFRPSLVLAYPRISRSALLRELAREMEIEIPARISLHALINAVQDRIFELHSQGIKPVIIIDEVHFLGGDTLHLLRTLSNIETATKKLVTILLFGEELFMEKVRKPRYRAILSRTFSRAQLGPLESDEIEQYVKFRCLMAGGRPDLFESGSFALLREISGGIPREINRICHNALERAAAKRCPRVNHDLLRQLAREEEERGRP